MLLPNFGGQIWYILVSNTTTLHMHHAILKISLPSLHGYDVKMPSIELFIVFNHKLRRLHEFVANEFIHPHNVFV